MKKIYHILTLILALTLAGCGKEEGPDKPRTLQEQLCGEWHSSVVAIEADIYLAFSSDGSFELYQQIGQGAHRLYRGSWTLEGKVLSGKYKDGTPWGASYEVSVNDSHLTLKSMDDTAEESSYIRESVPANVREGCETVI